MSNVVLTAYSVKNGLKGTIANDISGEAQSVAYLLKFAVFRCLCLNCRFISLIG